MLIFYGNCYITSAYALHYDNINPNALKDLHKSGYLWKLDNVIDQCHSVGKIYLKHYNFERT